MSSSIAFEPFAPFAYDFFRRGMVVAVLAGALCGLVGVYVVLRSMSYVGHGLSHAVFGGAAMSAVLGVLYTSVAFGTLLGPTLAGWVFDSTGSYTWPILICTVGCVISALMVWKLPRS